MLIGQYRSTYLELLRVNVDVESGARVAPVRRLDVTEQYFSFSATCGSDTLVAMSYREGPVGAGVSTARRPAPRGIRTHPFGGAMSSPVARRSTARRRTERSRVAELAVSGAQIERRRQLIAADERIDVFSWCAVDDGLAIVDMILGRSAALRARVMQ